MRVAIIGPPGIGKTTTGELVADALDWEYVDSDDLIPTVYDPTTGTPDHSSYGDIALSVLEHVAEIENDLILTIGGLSLVPSKNRAYLVEHYNRIFRLTCSPEQAAQRRWEQHGGEIDKSIYIGTIIKERTKDGVYDIGYPVDTSDKDPQSVAQEILDHITNQ